MVAITTDVLRVICVCSLAHAVWNSGFRQEDMNTGFAEWEVLNGSLSGLPKSNLDAPVPGALGADIERRQYCMNHSADSRGRALGSGCWARRRHARRIYEISRTFEKVFGPGSTDPKTGRVRMVYASFGGTSQFQMYACTV